MQRPCYWRQSDRDFNPNFNRLWREPEWVVRLDKSLSGAVHGKLPDRPPGRRKGPAPASTRNRPLVQAYSKTFANDDTRQAGKAEARRARAEAEKLFAQCG